MCIRLATLAGVTAVAITATIKQINADQHLPLTNPATADSAQAEGSTPNRPCGCSLGLESSAPSHAPTPRSGADYFELELKKLRQAIIDTGAQREQADKERKLLEKELNDMKRLLAAAQQLQAQKDAQIADLKGQLTGTPTVTVPTTKTPTSLQRLGRIRSGPVAPEGASSLGRAKPTKSAVQIFAKASRGVNCVRAVRPPYYYGPYEVIPPWEEILR
jgi:hypothetical protein